MSEFDDDFDNNNYDPLAEMDNLINSKKVHIKIQKRNARKSICTIEGLEMDESQLKDLTKEMKKKFAYHKMKNWVIFCNYREQAKTY